MTEYTCDSFRFFNLFPVYFGGKGTAGSDPGLLLIWKQGGTPTQKLNRIKQRKGFAKRILKNGKEGD